jgi:hypothetical protein
MKGRVVVRKKHFVIKMNVVTLMLPGLLLLQFANDEKIFLPDKICS